MFCPLDQAVSSPQWRLTYLDPSKSGDNKYLDAMTQRESGPLLHWFIMPRSHETQCFCNLVCARCLTTNIDIVRTRVWESTDVDGVPVTTIAINARFMIHNLQEVQGLEHKTVQLREARWRHPQRLHCNLQAWLNHWAQGHRTGTTVKSNTKSKRESYFTVIHSGIYV